MCYSVIFLFAWNFWQGDTSGCIWWMCLSLARQLCLCLMITFWRTNLDLPAYILMGFVFDTSRQTSVMVSLNLLLPGKIIFSKPSLKRQSNPLSVLLNFSQGPVREYGNSRLALKGKSLHLWVVYLNLQDRFSPLGKIVAILLLNLPAFTAPGVPICHSTNMLWGCRTSGMSSTPPCLPGIHPGASRPFSGYGASTLHITLQRNRLKKEIIYYFFSSVS